MWAGDAKGKEMLGKAVCYNRALPDTCVTTKSTFTSWTVPSPGPRGRALVALWPHQHKPCPAGEGTRGAEGELPVEVGAGSLAYTWINPSGGRHW